MVIQNVSSDKKITDITFTIKRDDLIKQKKYSKIKILNMKVLLIMLM